MSKKSEYKFSSLQDLQLQAKTGDLKGFKVDKLCDSSGKVFKKAQDEFKVGNHENAYILFYKFCELCKLIIKRPDFKKDEKYYEGMHKIKANFCEAIKILETLTQRLETAYSKLKQPKPPDPKTPTMKRNIPNIKDNYDTPASSKENKAPVNNGDHAMVNGTSQEPRTTMTHTDLYNLIKQKSTSYLLLDVRPSQDYDRSQIKSPNSLSLAEDRLNGHVTASSIEKNVVKIQDRSQWLRRDTVDKLILLDWNSKSLAENPALTTITTALSRWDMAKNYKHPPILLEGGFEMFRLAYPHMVTDPKYKMPGNKDQRSKETSNMDLEKVVFPNLDQGFMVTPSPSPKSLPALNSGAIRITRPDLSSATGNGPTSHQEVNYPSLSDIQNVPFIDRRSKPASSTTTNKIDDSASSTTNGDDFNNARLSGISVDLSRQEPSSAFSSTSSLNKAMIASTLEGVDESTTSIPPKIDRSSKPTVESVFSKASKAKTQLDLDGLLEVEGELADLSLDRRKENLEKELEWARLCQKREQEANEDLRAMHDEQALRLSEELEERDRKILEADQREKDLRDEIEKLRQQLSKSRVSTNDQIRVVENQKKEEEDNKLKREIEEIRRKRKMKEEQQREIKRLEQKALIEKEKRKMAESSRRRDEEEAERRRRGEPHERRRQVEPDDRKRGEGEERGRTTERLKDGERGGGGGGKLRRSYSCLNVAQMLDQEGGGQGGQSGAGRQDQGFIVPVPKFDRKQKPMDMVKRDFAGVWGTTKPGITGLRNLGNTCYMNSILQCVSNTEPIVQYFVSRDFEEDLNRFSDTKGQIADEFAALLQQLWSHQYKSISPTDMKAAAGRFKSEFAGRDQQDSHEFLCKLLEWLHNDTNRIKKPSKMPELEYAGLSPHEASKKFWRTFLERNQSIIVQLFHGLTMQTTTCLECGFNSLKFQEFYNLTLYIPEDRNRISLEECLRHYIQDNDISYTCEKCRSSRGGRQKLEIIKLPPILIIHLERFLPDEQMISRTNEVRYRKKQNFVSFKLTNLNLGEFTRGNENKYTTFNLYAVSNHFGSLEGGHYTATCYSKHGRSWYKYDDQDVSQIDDSRIESTAAYILFYSALDSNHPLLPLG